MEFSFKIPDSIIERFFPPEERFTKNQLREQVMLHIQRERKNWEAWHVDEMRAQRAAIRDMLMKEATDAENTRTTMDEQLNQLPMVEENLHERKRLKSGAERWDFAASIYHDAANMVLDNHEETTHPTRPSEPQT